jgi:DNA helicase HerA-like ATPase
MIFPPASRLGPLTADERQALIQASPFHAIYDQTVDRESAYEKLRGKPAAAGPTPGAIPAPAGRGTPDANDWGNHAGQPAQQRPATQPRQSAPAPQETSGGGIFGSLGDLLGGTTGPRGGHREGVLEAAAKSAARGMAGTVGRSVGQQILRGVLGSILGGRR